MSYSKPNCKKFDWLSLTSIRNVPGRIAPAILGEGGIDTNAQREKV